MDILKLTEKAGRRDLTDCSALEDYFEAVRLLEKEDFGLAHELVKEVRRVSAREAKRQLSGRILEICDNPSAFLAELKREFEEVGE